MGLPSRPGTIHNFGRNLSFAPRHVYSPRSEEEVLEILRRHRGAKIRAIGRLHSWSGAPAADEVMLDLRHLQDVRVERTAGCMRATVGAGCQIKRLLRELRLRADLTLPSLGLITEQTLAGATATGTHGSGKHSLSHYMDEFRIAVYDLETGEPTIRTVSCGPELRAARCSLGALGVVLSVAFQPRPAYNIEEHAETFESVEDVLAAEEDYPLQQFYFMPWEWRLYSALRRETKCRRSWHATLFRLYWFTAIDVGFHVLLCFLVRMLRRPAAVRFFFRRIVPWFVIRKWRVVDSSERTLVMEHELFRHIEIEIFVRRDRLPGTIAFVREILATFAGDTAAVSPETRERLREFAMADELEAAAGAYQHHYPIAVRKILPDDTLISMAAGDEPVYSISFISYARPSDREGFFRFARFLAKSTASLFGARPHWGKHCPLDHSELAALDPRLPEFRKICRTFDPQGVFRNAWVDEKLGFADDAAGEPGGSGTSDRSQTSSW